MIRQLREAYNKSFTEEKYQKLCESLVIENRYKSKFRIAETPIFIPEDLYAKLLKAGDQLIDFLTSDKFKSVSETVLSKVGRNIPAEDSNSTFLQLDFGISRDTTGNLFPYLIEMQGFPSLYFFQSMLSKAYKQFFDVPAEMNNYFGGLDEQSYLSLMREIIVGDSRPENTVLLEIDPENQNTAIDFYATREKLGIKVLDLKDVKIEGRDLYYLENGRKVAIERIYNRVIFDELDQRKDLNLQFDFTQDINAFWVGHPNWYFKISKYILPFIENIPYVPETRFLNTYASIPENLQDYVLKPLFSFSGSGVVFNVHQSDIDQVKDPENWVLQKKVHYEPVIESINPAEPVKCEIRLMYVWKQGAARPQLINNIVRLSKGDMIGVKFNKDKDWVGASCAYHS